MPIEEAASGATPFSKPTILVVDDAPDNLAVMTDLLRGEHRVLVATNGEKALALARENKPDIVLLDIMMPGMDGYEVCRRLKADDATRVIPVIFLTALDSDEDERKGLSLGAVDYITKPISPPIVIARIATHLTLAKARQFLVDKNSYLESEVTRRVDDPSGSRHPRGRREDERAETGGRAFPYRNGRPRRPHGRRHRGQPQPHGVHELALDQGHGLGSRREAAGQGRDPREGAVRGALHALATPSAME
jgi:CheY-like chemotaxis protein